MRPAAEFLEQHFPQKAAAWEAAAYDALTAVPRPIFPWPWVDLRLEPDLRDTLAGRLRITADFGMPNILPKQTVTLLVRCCVDCTLVGIRLPERDSYALIIDDLIISGADSALSTGSFPKFPAPGYSFALPGEPSSPAADPDAKDWDVPLGAGTGIALAIRNTSDAPMVVRVRGVCLVAT